MTNLLFVKKTLEGNKDGKIGDRRLTNHIHIM